jgi:hypothetical protein
MRPQTFELSKKHGFYQVTFFRKVKETSINSESFLKFDFAILILVYKSTYIRKTNFFFDFLVEKFFFLKLVEKN